MPPPPPPPPMQGLPKVPKAMPVKTGGGMDRNVLLASIQKGTTLKKAVTNDRSSPIIEAKVSPSTNGGVSIHSSGGGGGGGGGMANGGAPQLAGLFAGGMPKLRPTGRGMRTNDTKDSFLPRVPVGGPVIPMGKKPSAPPTPHPPPTSHAPPVKNLPSQSNHISGNNNNNNIYPPYSNGCLPPSPKPSSKSSPAPPPPPSNRKPNLPDRVGGGRAPFLELPNPSSKPAPPRPHTDLSPSIQTNEDKHPPLPAKPSFRVRPEPGYRGAPPRPPNSSKPSPPLKSPEIMPDGEPRRPSIDRSKSMREPGSFSHFHQIRVGTSAESPAAPFRTLNNHREAPPIPSVRPQLSKTVGRAAGNKLLPALRPPLDKPPKPPVRPVVAAPPPPSQPPPPPPSHRAGPPPPPSSGKPELPISSTVQPVPPPPPERNESTRTSNHRQSNDFESKFANLFKSRHQFPLPLIMNNTPKTYPSKSNGKNQRRAPLPPTSQNTPQNSSSSNNINQGVKGHFTSTHHSPPPPPPHAPIHLQMDRKFYGAEASHC